MRSRLLRIWGDRVAELAAAVTAIVILVGVLALFVPHLTSGRQLSGGVPAPPAAAAVTDFLLQPGQSACMDLVAVEPASRLAEFSVRPAGPSGAPVPSPDPPAFPHRVRPAVELVLSGPGYRARALAAAGHGYKLFELPIEAPRHSLLADACFFDRGSKPVLLDGTAEARTITRSAMAVAGASVVGDVSLQFYDAPPRSLLSSLGTVFARASRLSEGMMPVWLIWVFAVILTIGLPIAVVIVFYGALREDATLSREEKGSPASGHGSAP